VSRRGLALGVVAVASLFLPRAAHAHQVSTGVGPFYDGVVHFFVSFEEVLPVLALALLAGLQGRRHGRWLIALLPVSWLAGAALGLAGSSRLTASLPVLALLILPGALAAWNRALAVGFVAVLAAGFGILAGYSNGVAMGAAGAGMFGVLGAGCAVFAVTTLVTAMVASLRAAWMRIVARVAGSWLAALGMLAIGWMLRA
jgi:hydrogenase/urease accessory protein HupE